MAVTVSRDSRKSFASLFSRSRTGRASTSKTSRKMNHWSSPAGFTRSRSDLRRPALDNLRGPDKGAAAAFRWPDSRYSWAYCSSATTRENFATRSSTYADARSSNCSTVNACCARKVLAESTIIESAMAMNRIGIVLASLIASHESASRGRSAPRFRWLWLRRAKGTCRARDLPA